MKKIQIALLGILAMTIAAMSGCREKAIYPIAGTIAFDFTVDSLAVTTSLGDCTIKDTKDGTCLFDGFTANSDELAIRFRYNGDVSVCKFDITTKDAVTFNVRFVLSAIFGIELPVPAPL